MIEGPQIQLCGPNKRLRVLFVSHESGMTGAERSLLEIILGLDRKRFSPFVVVPRDGLLLQELDQANAITIKANLKWWIARGPRNRNEFKKFIQGLPKRAGIIRDLIQRYRIELVYSNSVACIDGAVGAAIARIPHLWHIHEILSKNQNISPYVPMWIVRLIVALLSKQIIVPSMAVKDDIRSSLLFRHIHVRYNGIDAKRFLISQQSVTEPTIRSEFRMAPDTKIIALIGYFISIKGHLDVVEAAKIVCAQRKDIVFLFIGGGNQSYRKKIELRVHQHGLEDFFIFLDFRENIDSLILNIDILICASWVESFSKVILEAMAAGKPVVATRCGGPEELVIDQQTGFLIPTHSPPNMAAALLMLLRRPDLMHSMGRKGQERAQKHFSIERYQFGIQNLLETFRHQ